MLYFLNLFGLKYILNSEFKYAVYMKEKLESEEVDSEEVGASQSTKMKYQQVINTILRETESTVKLYEENEKVSMTGPEENSIYES